MTTRTQQAAFAAHHPKVADRLHTIYTGYDGAPADPRPARRRRPGDAPFDVVHFGSFYGLRSAAPLLEAVAAVTRARSLPPDALRVVSFGYLPTADRALAERLGVTLEAPGRVPLADGRARLRQADLLFLPTFGDQELFIPGKLYDYLVAGRPVLALCRGEELTGILQRTGVGCAVDPEDGPGLVRALGEALDGRGWAGDGFAPDPVEITRFSAREATRALAGLLDDVRR